jgi:hypothetical protein
MKKWCLNFLATTALALFVSSAQATTSEQQLDQLSQFLNNQELTNPVVSQNLDIGNKIVLSGEGLKDSVDLNPMAQFEELSEVDEKLFDTFPMPVPESGSSLMMMIGAALIALIARRRHQFF